jgi:hypothetical protein
MVCQDLRPTLTTLLNRDDRRSGRRMPTTGTDPLGKEKGGTLNYNLLEEKWIPVLYKNGTANRVSIIDALAQASTIREIAASNPMDRVAILRFLLALLYRCRGTPPEDKDSLSAFPSNWFKKLEDKKKYFDLFREKQSFYQDHKAGGGAVPATNLLHDLPSGTNIAHFRHVRDFRDGLCPACCAMGLLRWASVASASKKGRDAQMTASIHGNTPAYSMRAGATLLETLRLNLPDAKPVEGDALRWEGATEESPLGILKCFTWQSRRVLLAPGKYSEGRDFSVGYCCYCGHDTDKLVRKIHFQPGWARPSKDPWWGDPHLLWVSTKVGKRKEKSIIPRWPGPNDPLEDSATIWHSVLQGLLQRPAGGGAKFDTTLMGSSQELYKHAEVHAANIPILAGSIQQDLMNELEWLGQVTWKTASGRTRDWNKRPKGHVVIDALCSAAAKGHAIQSGLCATSFLSETELGRAFGNLMQGLASAEQDGPDAKVKALEKWRDDVCTLLRRSVEQVTDLTTRGSPLRRREARDRATDAVSRVLRRPFQKEETRQ